MTQSQIDADISKAQKIAVKIRKFYSYLLNYYRKDSTMTTNEKDKENLESEKILEKEEYLTSEEYLT